MSPTRGPIKDVPDPGGAPDGGPQLVGARAQWQRLHPANHDM